MNLRTVLNNLVTILIGICSACSRRPDENLRMAHPFTATVIFCEKDEFIEETWTNCEFAEGNVTRNDSDSLEYKRLTSIFIVPMEWSPMDPKDLSPVKIKGLKRPDDGSFTHGSEGDYKEFPAAGGWWGMRTGNQQKVDVRSIRKLIQLGVTGPPHATGAWKKRLFEPPKPHSIILNDGRELIGKVSADITGLADVVEIVGTRHPARRT